MARFAKDLSAADIAGIKERAGSAAWAAMTTFFLEGVASGADSTNRVDADIAACLLDQEDRHTENNALRANPPVTSLIAVVCPQCHAAIGVPCTAGVVGPGLPAAVKSLEAPTFQYHTRRAIEAAGDLGKPCLDNVSAARPGLHEKDGVWWIGAHDMMHARLPEFEPGSAVMRNVLPMNTLGQSVDPAAKHLWIKGTPNFLFRSERLFVLPKRVDPISRAESPWHPADVRLGDLTVANRSQIYIVAPIPAACLWPSVIDAPQLVIDDVDHGMEICLLIERRDDSPSLAGFYGSMLGLAIDRRVRTSAAREHGLT